MYSNHCALVFPCLPDGIKLPKVSMVLNFFMKIRLNMMDDDLAFRFGVHQSSVSQNFHRVLDALYV